MYTDGTTQDSRVHLCTWVNDAASEILTEARGKKKIRVQEN